MTVKHWKYYWIVSRSRFEKVNFQTPFASKKHWNFKMDAHANDFQAKDDDSFYENMVDELFNPCNYEFSVDVTKGDWLYWHTRAYGACRTAEFM